ncbi:MAG: bifunctional phosphoserine phosphatase/homoserine phosphotransferase ThrH [SAR324 cluster bacterium]|nr:bifunctional phosphoserine phosphatase/homoserine phosphotransferase ThrH [SAR324 cluster bacterium]
MTMACLDLEGILIPEIWIGLAEITGISELRLTTRDIADYDELMTMRLNILRKHQLTFKDIEEVTNNMQPLEGALDFLVWLKQRTEVIILSDTFREFAKPLMAKLQFPTLLCHSLIINKEHQIENYCLRQQDQKRNAIKAFKNLNFRVIAIGDSYNDLSMLLEANEAFFFRPTQKITEEYPDIPVCKNYDELKLILCQNTGFTQ